MERKADIGAIACLLCLSVLLWLPRLHGPIDLRWDAGVYYLLGTSLAEGNGYRLLNEPGAIQAVQYPPLLPLLVSCHQWALGSSDPVAVGKWLRLSYFGMFLALSVAGYAMARQYLAPGPGFLAGAIAVLANHACFLSDLLFAELPFALVTVLFVICLKKNGWRLSIPAYLLGAMAYLLRTAGIALLAAAVAESLLNRRWRQAALRIVISLVPVVSWQLYVSHVTAGQEYQHPAYAYQRAPYQFYNVSYAANLLLVDGFIPELGQASPADIATRFFKNLQEVPRTLGEGITAMKWFWDEALGKLERKAGMAPSPSWLTTALITTIGCLVMAGAGLLLARREKFIPLYVAASVTLMCLTPWPGQFLRYVTPLAPFLALAFIVFLVSCKDYCLRCWPGGLRHKLGWAALVSMTLLVLVAEASGDLLLFRFRRANDPVSHGKRNDGRRFHYDQTWASYDAALAWLKGQAKSDDVIATAAPHWTYLLTGLKAVMPPMEVDSDKAQQLLDSVPVRYALVDDLHFIDVSRRYIDPAIQAHPQAWQLVYSGPDGHTRIYRHLD